MWLSWRVDTTNMHTTKMKKKTTKFSFKTKENFLPLISTPFKVSLFCVCSSYGLANAWEETEMKIEAATEQPKSMQRRNKLRELQQQQQQQKIGNFQTFLRIPIPIPKKANMFFTTLLYTALQFEQRANECANLFLGLKISCSSTQRRNQERTRRRKTYSVPSLIFGECAHLRPKNKSISINKASL